MVDIDFKILKLYFPEPEKFNLAKQKGVYAYDYYTRFEQYEETILPPLEEFHSKLNQSGITPKDYQRAKNVWEVFQCQNNADYTKHYIKTDVIILADIFETFRRKFDLDPAHYLTAPSLTWDRLLYESKTQLDLLCDYEMFLKIEQGIRGGISSIMGSRYCKAYNTPALMDKYNEPITQITQEEADDLIRGFNTPNYIHYIDATNLYGWAMQQPLPTGNFKWIHKDEEIVGERLEETLDVIKNLKDDDPIGVYIELDFEYPDEIKEKTKHFPLAPSHFHAPPEIQSDYQRSFNNKTKNKKLVCTQLPQEKYLIHYRNLKYYLSLGLKVNKIHSLISFNQSTWMKNYIDGNTAKRNAAATLFEKDLYKVLNNAAFGKTMEDIRKRRDIIIITKAAEAVKIQSRPTFKNIKIFSEDLAAIEKVKYETTFNKPIYVGFAILELSKLLMYKMFYDVLQPTYPNIELLYMDTDSFFLNIPTKDLYHDLENIPILKAKYGSTIGNFKDEVGGTIITECVFLRSKSYSYLTLNKEKKDTKCKGISKATVKNTITFQNMYNTLINKKTEYRDNITLNTHGHEMEIKQTPKIALSFHLEDGIKTIPYGYT